METLPPLPTFDNKMEVTETIEVEVETGGVKLLFVFMIVVDVTFDPEADEIVIECTEERLDRIE